MNSDTQTLPENTNDVYRDLSTARAYLVEIALMALRGALATDPRVVASSIALLEYRRAA